MGVAAFVVSDGLAVGFIGLREGIGVAVGLVLFGALGAVVLDAAGLLWRARRPLPTAQTGRGAPATAGQVLCLMLRDTFEVSLAAIVMVAGLTYAVLATAALSFRLLTH